MIKCFFTIAGIVFLCLNSTAQLQVSITPAQKLAMKQAKTLQDSLGLNNKQRQELFKVNMDLYQQKSRIRQQYAGNPAKMSSETQKTERTRDSLYRQILPSTKYKTYLQRKRTLLSN